MFNIGTRTTISAILRFILLVHILHFRSSVSAQDDHLSTSGQRQPPLDCISAHANGYRRIRMPKSSRITHLAPNHSPLPVPDGPNIHDIHASQFMSPNGQFIPNSQLLSDPEFTVPGTATIDEEIRYDPETSVFYRVRKIRRRKKKKNKNRTSGKDIGTPHVVLDPEVDDSKGSSNSHGPIVSVDNENKVHLLPEDHFITIEDLQNQNNKKIQNHNYHNSGIVENIFEGMTPIPPPHPTYNHRPEVSTTTTVSPMIAELLSKINDIQHQNHQIFGNNSPSATTEYSTSYGSFMKSVTESGKQFFNGSAWSREWNYPGKNIDSDKYHGNSGSLATPSIVTVATTPPPVITGSGTPIVYFTSARPTISLTPGGSEKMSLPAKVVSVSSQTPTSGPSPSSSSLSSSLPSSSSLSSTSSLTSSSVSSSILSPNRKGSTPEASLPVGTTVGIDSTRASVAVIAFCVALLLLTALILLVMHRETVWTTVWSLRTIFDPSSDAQAASQPTPTSIIVNSSNAPAPPAIPPHAQFKSSNSPIVISATSSTVGSLRRSSRRDPEARQQVPSFTAISANRIVDGVIVTGSRGGDEDDGELFGQVISRPNDHSYFESAQRSKQYLSRVQRWVPKRPPLPDDLIEQRSQNSYLHDQAPNSTFPRDFRSEC